MNQGRIWTVVNPTIGLPLFLGAVAVTSLIVHTAVLTHTTWFSTFLQGGKGKTALNDTSSSVAALSTKADSSVVIAVTPVAGTTGKGETSFVVTVTPNTPAASYSVGDATSAGRSLQTVAMTEN
jgi:light-harvesting protein B-800-850 alpha chain